MFKKNMLNSTKHEIYPAHKLLIYQQDKYPAQKNMMLTIFAFKHLTVG